MKKEIIISNIVRIYIGNYIEGIKEKYTSLNGNNFKSK
jgi:hypothetical protein